VNHNTNFFKAREIIVIEKCMQACRWDHVYKLAEVLDRCIMNREVSDANCAELKKACHSLAVHNIPPATVHHVAASRSMTFMRPATKRQAAMIAGQNTSNRASAKPSTAPGAAAAAGKRESAKRQRMIATGAEAPKSHQAPIAPMVGKQPGASAEENMLEDDLENAGELEDDKDAEFALVDEDEEDEEDGDVEGAAAAAAKSAPKRKKLILDSDDDDDDETSKPASPNASNTNANNKAKAHARVAGKAVAESLEDKRPSTPDTIHAGAAGRNNHNDNHASNSQLAQQPVASQFGEAEAVEAVPARSEEGGTGWGEPHGPRRGQKRGRENKRQHTVLEDDEELDDGVRGPCDDVESIQRSAAGVTCEPRVISSCELLHRLCVATSASYSRNYPARLCTFQWYALPAAVSITVSDRSSPCVTNLNLGA
jgi:hypothetical protein